jgi:cyclophilin family peptidyl-prolyl cis-trans isomerase
MCLLLRTLVCVLLLLSLTIGRAGTLAQFRTVFGDLEVELYDQDKPITVQNFMRYVQSGAYQNEFAHRLVPGFVVQGGGFTIANRGTTNAFIAPIATFPAITNEFGVGRRFSNVFGTIAMAKLGGDTNSATAQWFFNLADNAFLDAADTNDFFVVFGHVVRGTNVLNLLNTFQTYTGTQQSNLVANVASALGDPNFDSCPLLHPVFVETNLLFMDITLLQLQVQRAAGGGVQISWNGPAAMTNVLEFTTNLPPTWFTLVRTNGTGQQMLVVDKGSTVERFYRVRVEY